MKRLSGIVVLLVMIMAGCTKKGPTFSPELVSKAEAGDSQAQCNLGWCYETGTGVEKDEKKAVRWYTKSAEQGVAGARTLLALLLNSWRIGDDGVKTVEEIVDQ